MYGHASAQVTWLGYPGTVGGAFLDYIITDPVTAPLPWPVAPARPTAAADDHSASASASASERELDVRDETFAEHTLTLPHAYMPLPHKWVADLEHNAQTETAEQNSLHVSAHALHADAAALAQARRDFGLPAAPVLLVGALHQVHKWWLALDLWLAVLATDPLRHPETALVLPFPHPPLWLTLFGDGAAAASTTGVAAAAWTLPAIVRRIDALVAAPDTDTSTSTDTGTDNVAGNVTQSGTVAERAAVRRAQREVQAVVTRLAAACALANVR